MCIRDRIKKDSFEVEKVKHNEKILALEIEDIQAKIQQIRRLKVKKELQIAIQGLKKAKENRERKKTAEGEKKDQIDRLIQATNARLATIEKKEMAVRKEIDHLMKENEHFRRKDVTLR
eukprot:TRINITY_DN2623_c0_g2_i3.p2 TRINITY_DN2623_c0_g2~~TRINITY_DN2623_c0_g2_i3.p2  ORF type:complete len:139 (-),score=69.86 TRINITY_DN2623_c0_g2_i3:726-1082(-)